MCPCLNQSCEVSSANKTEEALCENEKKKKKSSADSVTCASIFFTGMEAADLDCYHRDLVFESAKPFIIRERIPGKPPGGSCRAKSSTMAAKYAETSLVRMYTHSFITSHISKLPSTLPINAEATFVRPKHKDATTFENQPDPVMLVFIR